MIYYVVYSKLNKVPEAMFRSKRWAERFVDNQQAIWTNAKFSIKEINLSQVRDRKLRIVHKITWMDYISHGLELLVDSIKTDAKKRHAGFFRQSK